MGAKSYRIYFNSRDGVPCAIDEGTPESEINVQAVLLYVNAQSFYDARKTPCFWLDAHGVLTVDGGIATIVSQPVP